MSETCSRVGLNQFDVGHVRNRWTRGRGLNVSDSGKILTFSLPRKFYFLKSKQTMDEILFRPHTALPCVWSGWLWSVVTCGPRARNLPGAKTRRTPDNRKVNQARIGTSPADYGGKSSSNEQTDREDHSTVPARRLDRCTKFANRVIPHKRSQDRHAKRPWLVTVKMAGFV